MSLSFDITDTISRILPCLTREEHDKLCDRLVALGVTALTDFEYLEPSELTCVLSVVNSRKLLKHWRSGIALSAESYAASPVGCSSAVPLAASPSSTSVAPLPQPAECLPCQWITEFQVPYHKARGTFQEALRNGTTPSKSDLLDFVRVIADDIYVACKKPGRKALTEIAKRIVTENINSLVDKIDGKIVGSGFNGLAIKLERRLDNLNRTRAPVETSQKKVLESLQKKDSHGCIAWAPDLPPGETLETQKGKQVQLKGSRAAVRSVMDEASTHTECGYVKLVAVALGIVAYLQEWKELLLIELGASDTVHDVTLPITPVILSSGSAYAAATYMIALDGHVAIPSLPNFHVALAALLASYFVFNIVYPPKIECTLEFFQRCFLHINPDGESYGTKKRSNPGGATAKVLSFTNALKSFEAEKWVFG